MRNYVPVVNKGQITNYFAEESMFNTSAVSFFHNNPHTKLYKQLNPAKVLLFNMKIYKSCMTVFTIGKDWWLFLQAILMQQDLRLRWFIEKSANERYEAFCKPTLI
jgi:hypothetical protein